MIWSIGIYIGDSAFQFAPPPGVVNPVLTRGDVSDVPAAFVADPFMVRHGDGWSMFFEVMNRQTGRGEIGLAVSDDGFAWSYRQIVLREPFHLSYPYVFEREGAYYMIPEALRSGTILLYKAHSFPTRWSCVGAFEGVKGADPSVVYVEGRWWLFVCATPRAHDTLRLYTAEALHGPWTEHPQSPLVEADPHIARPAGRVIAHEGRLIRYAQDCFPTYGRQVRAFDITTLTPTAYVENEHPASPVLTASGSGWNKDGMHHIDPHPLAPGRWIACVDGHTTTDR